MRNSGLAGGWEKEHQLTELEDKEGAGDDVVAHEDGEDADGLAGVEVHLLDVLHVLGDDDAETHSGNELAVREPAFSLIHHSFFKRSEIARRFFQSGAAESGENSGEVG